MKKISYSLLIAGACVSCTNQNEPVESSTDELVKKLEAALIAPGSSVNVAPVNAVHNNKNEQYPNTLSKLMIDMKGRPFPQIIQPPERNGIKISEELEKKKTKR